MVMSRRDYAQMRADPRRVEAGRKAADTRVRRKSLHQKMFREAFKSGFSGSKEDYIRQQSPRFDELLGTKWAKGLI